MKKAFTMIELIIIIAVIGIVAGIATPKLFNYRFDSELARVKSEYKAIQSKIKNKLIENIMIGKQESYNELGKNSKKIFTNVFKDGLDLGDKSKGWYEISANKYKYSFSSNTYYEFEYDKKGNFKCTKAVGSVLLEKAIECK